MIEFSLIFFQIFQKQSLDYCSVWTKFIWNEQETIHSWSESYNMYSS